MMHATQIPMPEPIEVIAALGFLLVCSLVAGIVVAFARRAVRAGASLFGIWIELGASEPDTVGTEHVAMTATDLAAAVTRHNGSPVR